MVDKENQEVSSAILSLEKEDECYKLLPSIRLQSFQTLGVDPNLVLVDLFANSKNHQESHYISSNMDAFSYDWGKMCITGDQILWANPPFSKLDLVATKVATEGCRIVLCVPVWTDRPWWKLLHHFTVNKILLPHPQSLYVEGWKKDGVLLPSPTWQTALFFLDSKGWSGKVDSRLTRLVQEKNLGKSWADLAIDMHKFAEIMVTLRSGREILDPVDEGLVGGEAAHEASPPTSVFRRKKKTHFSRKV